MVDFTENMDLLDNLREMAATAFRSPEQQVLYLIAIFSNKKYLESASHAAFDAAWSSFLETIFSYGNDDKTVKTILNGGTTHAKNDN
jgi:hypothetical protein